MADGAFLFQHSGTDQYLNFYNNQPPLLPSPRHNQQRIGSPIKNAIPAYIEEATSPSRSPRPYSRVHTPLTMYNQGHQQGQNIFMNGAHGHQRYGLQMAASKPFQSNQHHQPHTQHRQQQDIGHGHGTNYGNHQHNVSASGFSGVTAHFNPNLPRNGTPNHLQNGHSRPHNEHWLQQLALYREAQEATGTHPHARNHPSNKATTVEQTTDERTRQAAGTDTDRNWNELDLGGQGLSALSVGLFNFQFLTKLYLNGNNLTSVHPDVGQLRSLTLLDLSKNKLTSLPVELGMLVNLKTLLLFDNELESLPAELGSLFQLDMLGIEGNPDLDPQLKNIAVEHGSKALVTYLQESAECPEAPDDRDWIEMDDSRPAPGSEADALKVLSYNTLCEASVRSNYGYTPRGALAPEYRKSLILDEVRGRDAEIVCLQEVDSGSYNEFYRPELAVNGYKGIFWPKSRAKLMNEREAKLVDGCATFYKDSKFICLDKQLIDFASTAISRADMKNDSDVFNRVMPKDNIAVIVFLENRQTGARIIVANTHITWDHAYRDVKVVQTAILMEQITRIAETWSKHPPCKDKSHFRYADRDSEDGVEKPAELLPPPHPSLEYPNGASIPLLLCSDLNSLGDSGVYQFLSTGSLPANHPDLSSFKYGNFTRDGMTHPFALKSAYNTKVMPFTNYTNNFKGHIDYIWYSSGSLIVTGLLGKPDVEFLRRVPGFPYWHFPSDHLPLLAEFRVRKVTQQGRGGRER